MKLDLISTSVVAALVATTHARNCLNLTVPVTISARNGVFNVAVANSNIDATNFILNQGQQGHNYSAASLSGYATVSGTYSISARYCEPNSGPSKTIQILTHGIGFDKTYWDLSANNYNYSYVAEAVDQYGYSTFSYDRLGIGNSSHPDPIQGVQVWLETAALKALTDGIRAGTLPGLNKPAFSKVLHVGHSFGSIQTYTLTQMYPGISDGIALTGFSQNGSFVPFFLYGGNFVSVTTVPALASKYAPGYLAAGDSSAVQTNFFAPGDFDPAILQVAYTTGQPVSQGELLTTPGGIGAPNSFAGPVLIVTGQRDLPFCGGDCLATGNPSLASIPAFSKKLIPNASVFEAFIVPGAGHGLNLQYSHPLTYSTILNFFVQNGLPGSSQTSASSATAKPTNTASAQPVYSTWSSWSA